jgi:hypothetical protein
LQWVSAKTPEQREAARQRGIDGWMAGQAPTAKQLDYLEALGHRPPVANRLEASRTIDALLRGSAHDEC